MLPLRSFTPPHLCRRDLRPEPLSHDGIRDLILHHIVVVIVAHGVEAHADLGELSVTLEVATLAGGTGPTQTHGPATGASGASGATLTRPP